jgi:hypothetical protein
MNVAKALLLALVMTAPVAISAPALQATTVTGHNQRAEVSGEKAIVKKKSRHIDCSLARNKNRKYCLRKGHR